MGVLDEDWGWNWGASYLGQRNLSPTEKPDDELRPLPELGEFEDLSRININTLNWS